MKKITIAIILTILLSSCSLQRPPTAAPSPIAPTSETVLAPQSVSPGTGPIELTGTFMYSNEFVVETYFVEHAVALVDMHAFVVRDEEWEIPVAGQVLGHVTIDQENNQGAYTIQLPIHPAGILNDVDQNNASDQGVQVFAVSYWPNLYGGPYSEGDDRSRGWPSYLASVKTDAENEDEVTGGKLVVWAPDENQQFPIGYGSDGLLFTADDPVGSLPVGYSVVDLDQKPFVLSQETEPQLVLYEPTDVALKDFSADSYTQAFEKMFTFVRQNYAFNGVADKQPDWDKLYADLAPRVQDAENKKDSTAFFQALQDFVLSFKDGHVQLGGQLGAQINSQQISGGFGLALAETDDGKIIVTYVLENSPAANAGVQVGAEILTWNNLPIAEALSQVRPLAGPFSTSLAERYQQARYLLRVSLGQEASVTFRNPQGAEISAVLASIQEFETFNRTSIYYGFEQNLLPVEFRVLDSGAGYIKISSNNDDLNLIVRLFERALKTFQANNVTGLIIDLRENPGGSPLGLAGFLTDQEILMGQLEYFSEKTGKFEPEGTREKVLPNQNQYSFSKMALLVGQACMSACEIEAYGFSQVPGMIVVGQYPTGGVEAEVARGQFSLPEGIFLQVPTGRFTLPDGSIFLEGVGVQPSVRVPVNAETLLSDEDEVLKTAESIVLTPAGQGVIPSSPPVIATPQEALELANSGTPLLEGLARERYQTLSQPDQVYSYTIALDKSEPLAWLNGWCASSQAALSENLKYIHYKYILNGEEVPLDRLANYEGPTASGFCNFHFTVLDDWPAGEHTLEVLVTFDQPIVDGASSYPAGSHSYIYKVYVKP